MKTKHATVEQIATKDRKMMMKNDTFEYESISSPDISIDFFIYVWSDH